MEGRVDALVAAAARRRPAGPALIEPGEGTLTWGDLEHRVARAAGWLRSQGLGDGDRAVLLLPNGVAFVVACYAVLRAGGAVVPANVAYTAREVAHLVTDSRARLVLAHPALAEVARAAAPAGVAVVTRLGEGPPVGAAGGTPSAASAPADAVVAYTSGTTGRPKGARLSHANLLANLAAFSGLARLRLRPDDVLLGVLPFFHAFGLNVILDAAAEAGAAVLALPRFSPAPTVEAMASHGVTVAYGAPQVYAALNALADAQPVSLPALRAAVSGADALPVATWERFAQRYGVEIMEGYGLTEASPVVTTNCASPRTRAGTVGHALPGVRVRVAAPDGRPCATGEDGEVLVAGPNVFAGYLGDQGASAEVLRAGWLHTGDLGRLDADGYLTIAGRLKDLIIVSGFNVYPSEVEQVLGEHPAVADAAVAGAPDERTGERVCAFVVARPGASIDPAELVAHCRDRLARFKLPREVHVVEDLPRTAVGKLRRSGLRRGTAHDGAG